MFNVIADNINPRKWLPELPKYTLAGGKLKIKKAKTDDNRHSDNTAPVILKFIKEIINNAMQIIIVSPAAKPSIMSK